MQLYRRPDEYDLEHTGDDQDLKFYVELATRLKPKSVLELACGTGRITLPMAEEGARSGFSVVGLDSEATMLKQARVKARRLSPSARKRIKLVQGDMRKWHGPEPFELIIVPCSSITHLLEMQDQLDVWLRAFQNLAPGGRFVVEAPMPNFSAYADSFANPPRILVEIDRDVPKYIVGDPLRYFAEAAGQGSGCDLYVTACAQPLRHAFGMACKQRVALRMGDDRGQPGHAQAKKNLLHIL